jgi:FHA domain
MTDDDQTIDRDEMRARQRDAVPFAAISISGGEPVQIVGLVTIGRDPKSAAGLTVAVDGDPLVSKSHLALDRHSDQLVITDLGSSNGTFLHHSGQETPVPTDRWIPVPDGADVEFGDQRMTIETADRRAVAPAPAPAPAWSDGSATEADVCTNCARPLIPGARFCDVCGTAASVNALGESGRHGTWNHEGQIPPIQASAPAFFDPLAGGPASGAPASRGWAKKIVAAIAVLVALGLAAFVLIRVLGGDDSDASDKGGLPELPLKVDEQWAESARGEAFGADVGASSVYVASNSTGENFTMTSFASADGDEEWEVVVDVADPYFANLVGEYGDIVVFQSCGESCAVVGVDRSTGDIAWDRDNGDYVGAADVAGRLQLFEDRSIEVLDPSDGSRRERIRGDSSFQSGSPNTVVRDGDEAEVYDPDLNSVFGPVDIDTNASALSYTGSQLIVAVDDELQFLDESGDVVVESNLDGAVVEGITFIANDNVIVDTGESIVSLDPIDGDADMRWSEDGIQRDLIPLEDGAVVLIESLDGPVVDVIDVDTGDRRFRIDDVARTDQNVVTQPGTVGVLVISEDFDESSVDAQALDWADGEEIWAERFTGRVAFGEGALVEYTVDGDVTLYR